MYQLTLAGMIVSMVLLAAGFLLYLRFQWVFWFYYGSDKSPLLWNLFLFLVFAILYGKLGFDLSPGSGADFFSDAGKLTGVSLFQFLFCWNRWRDIASIPPNNWERHARKALLFFIGIVVCLRFLFVLSTETREQIRWERAEPCTVTGFASYSESLANGSMDNYVHGITDIQAYALLSNGDTILLKHVKFNEAGQPLSLPYQKGQKVRVFNREILSEPKPGLSVGLQEIKDAWHRKLVRDAKKAARKQ